MQGVTKITARLSNPLFSKCPFFFTRIPNVGALNPPLHLVPGARHQRLHNASPYCVLEFLCCQHRGTVICLWTSKPLTGCLKDITESFQQWCGERKKGLGHLMHLCCSCIQLVISLKSPRAFYFCIVTSIYTFTHMLHMLHCCIQVRADGSAR